MVQLILAEVVEGTSKQESEYVDLQKIEFVAPVLAIFDTMARVRPHIASHNVLAGEQISRDPKKANVDVGLDGHCIAFVVTFCIITTGFHPA
jgi:hypothetical protein